MTRTLEIQSTPRLNYNWLSGDAVEIYKVFEFAGNKTNYIVNPNECIH